MLHVVPMARFNWSLVNIAITIIGLLYVNNKISSVQNELKPAETSPLARSAVSSRFGQIVIYNRIPKTGSTTLTNAIGYDLCKRNGFSAIHLNMTKNRFSMNLADQGAFIRNVTSWSNRLPAFYHGHVAFIDFARFGYPNPIYINLIREPLDRLLSHYYFLRYGDNFRVGLRRSKAGDNQTFDECLQKGGKDCDMKQMWLQIPYFCGTASFCLDPGNGRALEQAKWNLVNRYLVVGVQERIEELIAVLEQLLPGFFRGALQHYRELGENRAHLRNTNKRVPPSEATLQRVHDDPIYKMEREFYDFAVAEFDALKERMTEKGEQLVFLERQFHYEKIKPDRT